MQSKTSADTLLKLKKNINISKCMVYIIFLVVLSLFAIFIGGSFFSLNNILNIIRQTAVVSMIAVTMTFVIAIGEIDLSVGSIVGAIIGSLLIGTINNGLMFFGLSTAQQTVAKGAIIILSVALSALVSLRDNNNK